MDRIGNRLSGASDTVEPETATVFLKTKKAPIRPAFESELGAGDENRTRTICLEGRGSTIELHPRTAWATGITITYKLRSCKIGTRSFLKIYNQVQAAVLS